MIDVVGAGVNDWKVGQRVNLMAPDDESRDGYAARFVVVPQGKLLPAPEGLPDALAATA